MLRSILFTRASSITKLSHVIADVIFRRLIGKVEVSPAERLSAIWRKLDAIVYNDLAPCSGFSKMYACMCDYFGYPVMDEIVWDLDTIYLSQDSRTLYLRDFDHLSAR